MYIEKSIEQKIKSKSLSVSISPWTWEGCNGVKKPVDLKEMNQLSLCYFLLHFYLLSLWWIRTNAFPKNHSNHWENEHTQKKENEDKKN